MNGGIRGLDLGDLSYVWCANGRRLKICIFCARTIWTSPNTVYMILLVFNAVARVLDMKDFIRTEQMLLGGISPRQAEVLSEGFTSGRPPSNCVVLDGFCEDFCSAVNAIKSTSAIGLAMVGENLGRSSGRLGWVAVIATFDLLPSDPYGWYFGFVAYGLYRGCPTRGPAGC